ncbi:MAG: ABC transporter ATP-binding protein [Bacillota bacterium]|nr:ABC transporter ATP-binding protein [Bacillota bacterium]
MITVEGLTYQYPRSAAPAVQSLAFQVRDGEIFGFLGPDGAGKTTTQKLLTGLLHGYRGVVRVFGRDLASYGPDYYNRVGVCFEQPNLYEQLTAEENLDFYRGLFDVPTERPHDLLRLLDLPVADRRTAGQYSKGMKARLALARSLLNRPKLWFLDEPTLGQDPQHSVMIRALIRRERERGATVFLTTHDMAVADELCDRVALIVAGRIAAVDSPRQLKLRQGRRMVRVEYRPAGVLGVEPAAGEGAGGLRLAEYALDDPEQKERFLQLVRDNDPETIHTTEPTLEDVFLKLTGTALGGDRRPGAPER